MRKKIEWKWESLDDSTKRAKVIGGWVLMRLVAVEIATEKKQSHRVEFKESMVFIADRDHEWEISAPFDPSNPGTVRPKSVNPEDFASPKA